MLMVERHGRPEAGTAPAGGRAEPSRLLIDRCLPRPELAVVHAGVFRVPPEGCYRAACRLDIFQAPLIRTLIGLRGLPQRLVGAVTGHRRPSAPARPSLRLGGDLVDHGFVLLGETPGMELVWGQVSRPWKPLAASTGGPRTPEEFAGFDQPGFAKIAFGLKVDPVGSGGSILTMETRVVLTDDQRRRQPKACRMRAWLIGAAHSTRDEQVNLSASRLEARQHSSPVGASCWQSLLLDPHAGLAAVRRPWPAAVPPGMLTRWCCRPSGPSVVAGAAG